MVCGSLTREESCKGIPAITAGDTGLIEKWSAPLTDDEREARNAAIFEHWLAGETTTEIARKSHLHRTAIDKIIAHATASKLEASSITDKPPIYNVWNYATCDPRFGQKHPGQIPGQAVVNLLLWSYALEAERKMGEMLRDTPRNVGAKGSAVTGGVQLPVRDNTPTLAELGLTKRESSEAQKLATLPEATFQEQNSLDATVGAVAMTLMRRNL